MATKFKHLEFLPLDEENLIVNDNPESNIQGKACLNLGFNAVNSITRLINICEVNKSNSNDELNFLNLSYSLESYLCTLLNINAISNIENTKLSQHYLKRQTNISSNKILPSFSYCQNLTFTRFKTWAGLYGTLTYFINLLEEYEEYYTPSEIAHYSLIALFKYCNQVIFTSNAKANLNNNLLENFYYKCLELIEDESIQADNYLYNLSKDIILIHPLTRELYQELNFYEEWLKEVILWKTENSANNKNLFIVETPSTNKQKAINTLLNCINILQQEGFYINNIDNLASLFIHQNQPNNLNNLISRLSEERLKITYVIIDNNDDDIEDILIKKFINNISKFRNTNDFNNSCNLIQEFYCPPGGYCLLMISLATALFNRAYILSYQNINNSEFLNISNIYKRILKLITLGSILLIKSNNRTAIILGENTLKTFNIYLEDIDPNNLLDN